MAEAQELGYAEADPTADVDGLDAADKIAILASLAFGGRIKLQDIYCEGIRQVSRTDIAYAEKLGFAIKLLAIAREVGANISFPLQVRVHPTLVPLAHPLASVNDVYNAIVVEGEPLGQVMLSGPGAGAGATASAVVSDILNLAGVLKMASQTAMKGVAQVHPLLDCSHQHYRQIAPMAELTTRFYVRFLTQDHPGVIGKLGTCFGNHGVSLESIVQTGVQEHLAEIVVVTHNVQEGNLHSSLAEIRTLEAVNSVPSLLRVL